MPLLPPRNLPFSSPDSISKSPSTPKSAKKEQIRRTSSTPTKNGDAVEDQTGVLPRQDETTFHRKLRILLWDFRRAYEKWIDLISLQGAKSVASSARLAASLDDILAKEAKSALNKTNFEEVWRKSKRMDEIAELLQDIEVAKEDLKNVMGKIIAASSKFASLSDAAEALLVEATQAKGSDFTFEREMWVSWSMNRFVSILQLVASRCIIQTSQLDLLSEALWKEGCAPGSPSILQLKEEDSSRGDKDEETDDAESDEEDEEEGEHMGRLKRKGRGRLREKILEEWQRLAFLLDENSDVNAELFEDICEVEVGRWDER